jgi:hypothetical protein
MFETSQLLINKKVQTYLTALNVLTKEAPSIAAMNALSYYASMFVQDHFSPARWTNFITVCDAADVMAEAVNHSDPLVENDIDRCVDRYLEAIQFLLD